MNCFRLVEVKFFHLCLEVRPQCAEIKTLPAYESGSTFDPLKVKKFRPSDTMK